MLDDFLTEIQSDELPETLFYEEIENGLIV